METKTFMGWMEHLKAEEPNTIPPMTHPYGKVWNQPDRSEVKIDHQYARMSKSAFDELCDYSRSQPSGVYEGKMWKTCNKHDYGWKAGDEIIWHLHWWSKSTDPEKCKHNVREIIIHE